MYAIAEDQDQRIQLAQKGNAPIFFGAFFSCFVVFLFSFFFFNSECILLSNALQPVKQTCGSPSPWSSEFQMIRPSPQSADG